MDLVVTLAQIAAFLALGLALCLPQVRRIALWTLGGAALLTVVHGFTGPESRTLTTFHHYAGYEGSALEVSMVAFPTGEAVAPGWQWTLPFLAFAGLWIAILALRGHRRAAHPLLLPLLYAWSATATWLGMQFLAAPGAVVQPAGLDRFLWPAGLAAALLAARAAKSIFGLIAWLSAAVVFARLPAALFSLIASGRQLGTSLDVSQVLDSPLRTLVNPVTKEMFAPPLEAGTQAHQFWLIWLEHVIIFPALHSLGLFGIALGMYLWHKHEGDPA